MNKFLIVLTFFAFTFGFVEVVSAQENIPSKSLINSQVIKEIKNFVNTDIVRLSVENQNMKYKNVSEEKVLELDKQWREETKSEDQPLISATLSSPLSAYLTRIQAHSKGLYTEMFVMDNKGLNVGQSSITSDYWQGDEGKFQKTYSEGKDVIFIDDIEFNKDLGIWVTQVNLSISDVNDNAAIGAITIEVNLSELQRRSSL